MKSAPAIDKAVEMLYGRARNIDVENEARAQLLGRLLQEENFD